MKNTKPINIYDGSEELYNRDGEIIRKAKFKKVLVNRNFFQTYLGDNMENVFTLYPDEFTLADRKVLDCLCLLMDDNNIAVISASELSEKLKLSAPTVYRAINLLSKHDYAQKKNKGAFLLNPDRFSRNTAEKRFTIKQEYLELLAKNSSQGTKNR